VVSVALAVLLVQRGLQHLGSFSRRELLVRHQSIPQDQKALFSHGVPCQSKAKARSQFPPSEMATRHA